MDFQEITIESEKIFSGKILNLRVDTVKLPNGNTSKREVVEHLGAVGVIPITEDRKVIMVRQFRKPVEEICLEIPAGKLNAGEDPYLCGVRELEEETGYKASKMQSLGSFYTTPGFSNEILHLYMATGLSKGEVKLDEDEFVEMQTIPLEQLFEMVMKGEIKDAKSIIAILKAYQLLK
ncbi:MAG: ADP-ribose pyrophosphatase [Clostridiales bacterium]|nr:ADP-ribose pyrophosphatase [Clostridiales bacterium]MDK2933559.1 ADP-ribose pyrophosphatase [Clostridiales bacterium]